jgi:hypothetical protein
MRRSSVFLAALFVSVLGAAPGVSSAETYAVPPEEIADAIVNFVPHENIDLHHARPFERPIRGTVIKHERGPLPAPAIVHTANTMIRPLEKGVPVKLFLKQYPGRDDYYVIAIFPVTYKYRGQP